MVKMRRFVLDVVCTSRIWHSTRRFDLDCCKTARCGMLPAPQFSDCYDSCTSKGSAFKEVCLSTDPGGWAQYYLLRFLSHGLKVGIVEQTETAALKKASDNRNRVFNRQLTQLYTAATFVSVHTMSV